MRRSSTSLVIRKAVMVTANAAATAAVERTLRNRFRCLTATASVSDPSTKLPNPAREWVRIRAETIMKVAASGSHDRMANCSMAALRSAGVRYAGFSPTDRRRWSTHKVQRMHRPA